VTCRLEGGCSIQLSYGAKLVQGGSMGPLFRSARFKIIGIRNGLPGPRLGIFQPVCYGIFLCISNGFFFRRKAQPHLCSHVAGAGPAHQRINLTRTFGFEFKHPIAGLGEARLRRRFSRAVNACAHGPNHRLEKAARHPLRERNRDAGADGRGSRI
jgi:hypothetical protein